MKESIFYALFMAMSLSAAPLNEKRQFPSVNGVRGASSPAQILAFQQQQQALAKINAQQVSENVYRVQPTDQASTYSSALIILMPKEGQAGTLGDLMKLTPVVAGAMSPVKGQQAPAAAGAANAQQVPATAPTAPLATPTPNQAPVPVPVVAPANQAQVPAAGVAPTPTGAIGQPPVQAQTQQAPGVPITPPAAAPGAAPATAPAAAPNAGPQTNPPVNSTPAAQTPPVAAGPGTTNNNGVSAGKMSPVNSPAAQGPVVPETAPKMTMMPSVPAILPTSIIASLNVTGTSTNSSVPMTSAPIDPTPAGSPPPGAEEPQKPPTPIAASLTFKQLSKDASIASSKAVHTAEHAEPRLAEQTGFGAARGSGPVSAGLSKAASGQ